MIEHAPSLGENRQRPIDGYPLAILVWLALGAVLLPLLLLGAYGFNSWVANEQAAQLVRVSGYSANLAHNVDRELRGFQETADILAGSRHLQWGDIKTFDELARDAAAKTEGGQFILSDRSLQQLVNTEIKPGEALPKTPDSEAVRRAFATGQPIVSDLTAGTIASRLQFAVHVPVRSNNEIRYVLSYVPRSDTINAILQQTSRPEGWLASLIDGTGNIIARSLRQDELFGKPESSDFLGKLTGSEGVVDGVDLDGRASVTSYYASGINGWKSIVWAPKEILEGPRRDAGWATAGLVALALAASVLAAWLVARMMGRPVSQLVSAASAIGRGEPVTVLPTPIREAQIIGQALFDASRSINTREAELKESEARFRNMADYAPVMIWVTAPDGECTFIGQSWYDFTGQTTEMGLGFGWLDAVHHDDRASSKGIFLEANAKKEAFQYEYRLRRKDGAYRWVIVSARPRSGAAGEFLGYIGSITDISDRKLAEEAANEARRFAENLMNAAPVSIYIFNRETERNELANTYAGEMLGYDPETWKQKAETAFELMHPDDARTMPEHFDRLASDTSGQPVEIEYRLRHADGSWRWFLSRDLVYERAADGRLRKVLGTAIDITEREQAGEALRASDERFRLAINAARALTYDVDLRQGSKAITFGLENVTGYRDEDGPFTSEWWHGLVHPDDLPGHLVILKRHMRGGGRYTSEYRIHHAAGHWIWIQDDGEILLGPDGPTRITGTNIDITERKQREEQIRLLMREVNHRSKNMLAVIQVIARQTAASSSQDFVRRFGERVQSLAVTQDLLVKNEWLGVDLEELVAAQLRQFKGLAGTRISLEGKPLRISAASAQNLGLAIHELASNAGKYGALSNDNGQVAITWRVKKAKSKDGEDRFVISWIERKGPPILTPQRRGFGSTVMGTMVKMGLSAEVELNYAKKGFEWHLECPIDKLVERSRMAS